MVILGIYKHLINSNLYIICPVSKSKYYVCITYDLEEIKISANKILITKKPGVGAECHWGGTNNK